MTATAPTTVERPVGVPVRRPDVDLATAPLHRWLVDGDPLFSHLLAALSAVFPNGEDFFVDSVRHYRGRIEDDPDLKARVKGFIGQESMHGREHRTLNARLAELGYPTVMLDRDLATAARILQRLPDNLQLAVTVASEHFTTALAYAILSDEQTRATLFADPDAQVLITWHALEELEHKDVPFDVFDAVDGRYAVRLAGLALAAVGFGSVVVRGYVHGLVADRRHLTPRAVARNVHNLRRQQILSLGSGRRLLALLRPGAHPRDLDTDALVHEWRERLAPSLLSAPARSGL
jgi:predicted metal-dependent hydrolase